MCLLYATRLAVKLEARRCRVAATPGTIEAWIDRTIGCESPIPTGIGHCDFTTALREHTIPSLRDLLTAREGKDQAPTIDG